MVKENRKTAFLRSETLPDFHLIVNGKLRIVELDDSATPLLWVLRDSLGLVGTKFGCGIAQCGACTVHLNGAPIRSCSFPVSAANGKEIRTIEGLAKKDGTLHALQQAWIDFDVAQCGYCQAGQIMSAAALLEETSNPKEKEIEEAMAGNYCRCGTYNRIKAAIRAAASAKSQRGVIE